MGDNCGGAGRNDGSPVVSSGGPAGGRGGGTGCPGGGLGGLRTDTGSVWDGLGGSLGTAHEK